MRSFFHLPPSEGQGLVEYALILVMVFLVVIGIMIALGDDIVNLFVYLEQILPFD